MGLFQVVVKLIDQHLYYSIGVHQHLTSYNLQHSWEEKLHFPLYMELHNSTYCCKNDMFWRILWGKFFFKIFHTFVKGVLHWWWCPISSFCPLGKSLNNVTLAFCCVLCYIICIICDINSGKPLNLLTLFKFKVVSRFFSSLDWRSCELMACCLLLMFFSICTFYVHRCMKIF